MSLVRTSALLAFSALVLAGCQKPPEVDPSAKAQEFLKWSMNQYAALKSFEASERWSMSGQELKEKRHLVFVHPNKFKIVANLGKTDTLTTVSDGTKLIEIANVQGGCATVYDAPANIGDTGSMLMRHPMFNGSPLYQFFEGSDNFYGLVDTDKGKVELGDKVNLPGGEEAQTVKFYSAGGFGYVEVLIDTKSGLVYSIQYDGLPEMLKDTPEMRPFGDHLPSIETTEVFSDLHADVSFPDTTFNTAVPKGMKVNTVRNDTPPSPVPIGKPAPDFELTALDGKKVKLSSLKGKVVMIDFWATWCPPCRESLPITNRINTEYASKGLQVLVVSNEDPAKIKQFVEDNKYTFPAMVDVDSKAAKAYGVDGIPCVAIIDAQGNLSSYSVGLRPEADLIDRLKKAGLKTD